MADVIVIGLERDRARLVKRLEEAESSARGLDGLAIGNSRLKLLADCRAEIARIDHNLRVIADANRT